MKDRPNWPHARLGGRKVTRAGLRRITVPAVYFLLIGIIAAFLHSGLQGEHGLIAQRKADLETYGLQAELEDLRRERARLGNRVLRLGNDYLDLDLLDERARAVLGLVRADEMIVR